MSASNQNYSYLEELICTYEQDGSEITGTDEVYSLLETVRSLIRTESDTAGVIQTSIINVPFPETGTNYWGTR